MAIKPAEFAKPKVVATGTLRVGDVITFRDARDETWTVEFIQVTDDGNAVEVLRSNKTGKTMGRCGNKTWRQYLVKSA